MLPQHQCEVDEITLKHAVMKSGCGAPFVPCPGLVTDLRGLSLIYSVPRLILLDVKYTRPGINN